MVRLGNTTILAGIQLALGEPTSTSPEDGVLEVTVNLSPVCSPRYAIGRPPVAAIALGELLSRVIIGSRAMDLKDFGILPGVHVWHLHCDVVCLEDDGNVTDAALVALLAALQDLDVPASEVSEDGVVTVNRDETTKVAIGNVPIPSTFGCFGESVISDPTADEEDLMDSTFTVMQNSLGQVRRNLESKSKRNLSVGVVCVYPECVC